MAQCGKRGVRFLLYFCGRPLWMTPNNDDDDDDDDDGITVSRKLPFISEITRDRSTVTMDH